MEFLHTELANGLTIVGERNPQAQSMAVGYFVRTGARDENPRIMGVSHFLEHMMFKGTDRRSAEDVNREFDEMGAEYNAFTTPENTVYYGRVLPEHQYRLLDLLTDMMRPSLRVDDFDVEKNVILEEIAMYQDRPTWVAFDAAREQYFGNHPLGHLVLGTRGTITSLERDEMLRYFAERYSPGNMVLAFVGNFDWAGLCRYTEDATSIWKPFDAARDAPRWEPNESTRTVRDAKLKKAHLVWMMPGVSAQDPLRYAANVLATAIGDDVGSRLYWELVDTGLADTASLSHDEEDGIGEFVGYVSCAPENAGKAVATVSRVLDEATARGLDPDEIERAKRKMAASMVIRSEAPDGRLAPVGLAWQYRREYVGVDATVDRVLSVNRDEISAFLDEHPLTTRTLLALGPFEDVTQVR
ncbi:insulinase family protein [Candidatus Poribacteria bacterium]|nr:insulinase family protein [Candidatus Poribacteria bacterium]